MITAKEALALPKAQLTDVEREGAIKLLAWFDEQIRDDMTYDGVSDLKVEVTNRNVIAFVMRTLKRNGWLVNGRPDFMPHPLNKAVTQLKGYIISLVPNDEVYEAVGTSVLPPGDT